MSRPVITATGAQRVLMSYLDALLQDAGVELAQSAALDEFAAAVRAEQVRDARRETVVAPAVLSAPPVLPPVMPAPRLQVRPPPAALQVDALLTAAVVSAAVVSPAVVSATVVAPAVPAPAMSPVIAPVGGPPSWAQASFECLLFDVAGLTLAAPLVCLGSIHPLAGRELTPLFAQPDWFLGILPTPSGNLKVVDTARWVMPERYRDELRNGLQYVISVQGYEWGFAVHQVSRAIQLEPNAVQWRGQRTKRAWLAGTVIEHMCALLDVRVLAEIITSGAAKRMING